MALPTVECFRALDLSDQLLALYEAALGLEASQSFSPDQIEGLEAWYKDSGIVHTLGDVDGWDDSANANNLNAVNGTALLDPAAINGFDVVLFTTVDGTTGTPLTKGSALFSGTAASTFIVANKDSTWNEAGIYTTKLNFQANHHPFSDNAVYDANFSTARKSCGAQVVAIPDNWRIFSIRSQDGAYQMEIDGVLQFATGTNIFNAGQDFVLGAGASDGFDTAYALQGRIAEVIVYNVFLTDVQRDQVINYLRTRFALP